MMRLLHERKKTMIPEHQMTPKEICDWIDNPSDANLTCNILEMFLKYDLSYKVRSDGTMLRIYCYIKKSKEAMIINTRGYNSGTFDIQLRITNPATLNQLDVYSERIREQILNAPKNCLGCCHCNREYVFTYRGKQYRKCHMLCDNFSFFCLSEEDRESLLRIIRDEIYYAIPKNKKHLLD